MPEGLPICYQYDHQECIGSMISILSQLESTTARIFDSIQTSVEKQKSRLNVAQKRTAIAKDRISQIVTRANTPLVMASAAS